MSRARPDQAVTRPASPAISLMVNGWEWQIGPNA
jgi:hypothetical protein